MPAYIPVRLPLSPPGSIPASSRALPRRLQNHPLSGVHQARLNGRNPEELRVELFDLIHEPAAGVSRIPGGKACGEIIRGTGVPAPVRHRVLPRFEPAPEGRQIRSTRKSAGHSDDRDALAFVARGRPCPCHRLRFGPCLRLCQWSGRAAYIAQLFNQVPGQGRNVGVVEHRGVGHRVHVCQGPVQTVPQLYRHQRVHPPGRRTLPWEPALPAALAPP